MSKGIEFPPETRAKFLAALALTGRITGDGAAAEQAGIASTTLYTWRNRDPQFAADWDAALQIRFDFLASKGWKVVEDAMDSPKVDIKDKLAAAKIAIDKTQQAQRVDIQASGEIKFVIESAFPTITGEIIEETEEGELVGDENRAALPGKPETS